MTDHLVKVEITLVAKVMVCHRAPTILSPVGGVEEGVQLGCRMMSGRGSGKITM